MAAAIFIEDMAIRLLLVPGFLAALVTGATVQDECPTAQSARSGFELRSPSSTTQVKAGSGVFVEKSLILGNGSKQTSVLYEGLFIVEETTVRNTRTLFRPGREIAAFFPVKSGGSARFSMTGGTEGEEKPMGEVTLAVIGQRSLSIGPCSYDVFLVERKLLSGTRIVDQYVEYYAPTLRFVVAKEFRNTDGTVLLRSYLGIRPAIRGGAPI